MTTYMYNFSTIGGDLHVSHCVFCATRVYQVRVYYLIRQDFPAARVACRSGEDMPSASENPSTVEELLPKVR